MRLRVVGVLVGLAAVVPAQSVRSAIAAAEKLGARTGVCVLDARGRVLFERRANEAFAPASNQKLLTAAAVLQGLGQEHRFVTRFELKDGALVVRASGDPNWISGTAHSPADRFGEVIAELQRRGIRAVSDVVFDAGTFTGPTRPAGWPQDQLYTYYCAPTGPFVLDQGIFWLRIDPRGRTNTAAVRLDGPMIGPSLQGKITLVRKRGVSSCGAIDRGDRVLVRGKLSQRSGAIRIRTAVIDPKRWYERTLRELLKRAGIAVSAAAAAPPDGPVHEVTTTVGPALLRMLEDSSNFDAEQLLRVLGDRTRNDGSLRGGLAAMRENLTALIGALPDAVVLADGSGLSRANRVTPAVIARSLHRAKEQPFGGMLRSALPIAGRTGTLKKRFVGTDLVDRVWAKTGWIRGVSSLSGYVERDGQVLSFAILMTYDKKRNGLNKDLKRLQERIVAAIGSQ